MLAPGIRAPELARDRLRDRVGERRQEGQERGRLERGRAGPQHHEHADEADQHGEPAARRSTGSPQHAGREHGDEQRRREGHRGDGGQRQGRDGHVVARERHEAQRPRARVEPRPLERKGGRIALPPEQPRVEGERDQAPHEDDLEGGVPAAQPLDDDVLHGEDRRGHEDEADAVKGPVEPAAGARSGVITRPHARRTVAPSAAPRPSRRAGGRQRARISAGRRDGSHRRAAGSWRSRTQSAAIATASHRWRWTPRTRLVA